MRLEQKTKYNQGKDKEWTTTEQTMHNHNLPTYATPFIGRQADINQMSALLNDPACRLITLLGEGGIGKTRLGITVAHMVLPSFDDGVWLVNLQAVRASALIASTIAEAIQLQFAGGEDLNQQLISYLRDKNMLLLLDNYEQLLQTDSINLLADILKNAPSVKLLLTSREALNLQEEWRYPLKGLSIPVAPEAEDLESFSSIQLFITCVRRISPHLNLVDMSDCMVQICKLVEGVPLAIEMATSWLSVLPCDEIVLRIEQGLLDSRLQNVPERHRSMSVVFEQSWNLLRDDQRDVFCKLSVFADGFQKDAALVVANATLEILADLVDKSLLQLDTRRRYKIHELLRQFAEDKLKMLSDQPETVRDQHCEYYARFVHQHEEEFRVQQSPQLITLLEEEVENLRAMWQWGIEHRKIEQIQQTVRFMAEYYDFRNWYQEGTTILGQAIEALYTDQPEGSQGVALGLAFASQGNLLHNLGQIQRAEEQLRAGISILRALNTKQELAWALSHLNRLLFVRGAYAEAEKTYRESIPLARETGDQVTLAYELGRLGYITSEFGRYNETRELRQEALIHFQSIKHRMGEALLLSAIAETLYIIGDYQQAQHNLHQSLSIMVELDSQLHISYQFYRLGLVTIAIGDYQLAEQHLRNSLQIATEVGEPQTLASSQLGFGDLFYAIRDFEQSSQHYHQALTLSRQKGMRQQEAMALLGIGKLHSRTGAYERAYQTLHDNLSLYQILGSKLGIAQALNARGRVSLRLGNPTEAYDVLYEALQISTLIEVQPVILDTIVSIAEFITTQGNSVQATELLTLCLHHPASHSDTKHVAQQLLTEMEQQIPAHIFADAYQQGKVSRLDDIIQQQILELPAPQANSITIGNQTLVEPLSQRELEVLALIVQGYTNREIASQLHISINTVKKHINHIFGKLRVKNRVQAIIRAKQLNLSP